MSQPKFWLIALLFWSCTSRQSEKQPILLASREAPLGWVYLKLYSDSSFEFISSGLRDSDIYPGTFKINHDTIFFKYSDSIPKLQSFKAIIHKGYVNYIGGTYPESVQITLNKVKLPKDAMSRVTNQDHLKIAREFAESYKPDSIPNNNGVANVPKVADSVLIAFKSLAYQNNEAAKKYLTLIFLKLYRAHMQCCHQSYELREGSIEKIDSIKDPLLYVFNDITKLYDHSARIEFVSSAISKNLVDSNQQLLQYDKIKLEYRKIQKVEDSIMKGLYWE